MNPFQSLRDYEEYVYALKERFPSIHRSTLILFHRGARVAILQGELSFAAQYRVTIRERLSFDTGTLEIESYGYELWRGDEKIAWYDPQPHPNDPALAETFPHHKHIPPDISRHRIPATEMSFTHPNLEALVREIERLLMK